MWISHETCFWNPHTAIMPVYLSARGWVKRIFHNGGQILKWRKSKFIEIPDESPPPSFIPFILDCQCTLCMNTWHSSATSYMWPFIFCFHYRWVVNRVDISIRKLGRWTFYDRETQKDVKEEKESEKKSEAHEEKGSEKISKTKEKGKWRIILFLKKMISVILMWMDSFFIRSDLDLNFHHSTRTVLVFFQTLMIGLGCLTVDGSLHGDTLR